MRHLFVTNDFPPKTGGIESYLVTLCTGFDPDDIAVVAPARKGHEEVDPQIPYKVVRLPGTYLRARKSVEDAVVDAATVHRTDAIHFLQTLPLGRLARWVGKRTRKPVTVFAHGSEVFVPSRAPGVRRVARNVLTSADLVFAVSEFTKDSVERFTGGQARISVLPPSVDVGRFSLGVSGWAVRERLRLGSRFTVVFVARLVKKKGADILIRAMSGLPRAVAVIVGTGPEEATLRRLVDELEIGNRIVFAGRVSDSELPEYYAAADVFCMPCAGRLGGLDTEGFGIVYIEAAASGLPSVAGRCGGSVEAVLDGETGIVIDESTPSAVLDALRLLERDETLRATLGASARERSESQFAPDVLAARLEEEVEAATARARSAS